MDLNSTNDDGHVISLKAEEVREPKEPVAKAA
jgi:hypothetical protein